MRRLWCFAVLAVFCTTHSYGEELSDPAAGEKIFIMCVGCHSNKAEHRPTGPNLYGLVGRQAGTLEGFQYSSALKDSGIFWDERTLDEFIANPGARILGTMMLVGVGNPQDRASLIQYLNTLKE